MGRRWEQHLDDLIARRLRAYRKANRRATPEDDLDATLYALDIPARTEALSPLTAFVTEAARRGGLPARDASFVEVAIYEACLNVIEHAYGFDASRRVRVDLFEDEERLTFRITDTGVPLDAALLTDPGEVGRHTRRAGRGLGLKIIRRAMDEVSYESEDGENCMTLVKQVREVAVKA